MIDSFREADRGSLRGKKALHICLVLLILISSLSAFIQVSRGVAASTDDISEIGVTSAVLEGVYDEEGYTGEIESYFQYRITGTTGWYHSDNKTYSDTGGIVYRSEEVTGLDRNRTYEYRLKCVYDDGSTDLGSIKYFSTDLPEAEGTVKSITNTTAGIDADRTDDGYYRYENQEATIRYTTDSNPDWTTVNSLNFQDIGEETIGFYLSDLTPETKYYWRVQLRFDSPYDDYTLYAWSDVSNFTTYGTLPSVEVDNATGRTDSSASITARYTDTGDYAGETLDMKLRYRIQGSGNEWSELNQSMEIKEEKTAEYDYFERAGDDNNDFDVGNNWTEIENSADSEVQIQDAEYYHSISNYQGDNVLAVQGDSGSGETNGVKRTYLPENYTGKNLTYWTHPELRTWFYMTNNTLSEEFFIKISSYSDNIKIGGSHIDTTTHDININQAWHKVDIHFNTNYTVDLKLYEGDTLIHTNKSIDIGIDYDNLKTFEFLAKFYSEDTYTFFDKVLIKFPQESDNTHTFELTGLDSGETYEYKAAFEKTEYGYSSESEIKNFTTKYSPYVRTRDYEDLGSNSVKIGVEVSYLGSYQWVDGWVRWKKYGATEWQITDHHNFTKPEIYMELQTNLDKETKYRYQAVAQYEDGYLYGDTKYFTTKLGAEVETLDATDISFISAKIRGKITDAGDFPNTEVYFRYGRDLSDSTIQTTTQYADEGEVVSLIISELQQNTTYEYQAVAVYGDNRDESYGSVKTFKTKNAEDMFYFYNVRTDRVLYEQATLKTGLEVVTEVNYSKEPRVELRLSTDENITEADVVYRQDFNQSQTITQTIHNLDKNTKYYYRWYIEDYRGVDLVMTETYNFTTRDLNLTYYKVSETTPFSFSVRVNATVEILRDNMNVGIVYREKNANESWVLDYGGSERVQVTDGEYNLTVDELDANTTYEFYTMLYKFRKSTGEMDLITGWLDTYEFDKIERDPAYNVNVTTDELPLYPDVEMVKVSHITHKSARFKLYYDFRCRDAKNGSDGKVYFVYYKKNSTEESMSAKKTVDNMTYGYWSVDVTGLDKDTTYYVRGELGYEDEYNNPEEVASNEKEFTTKGDQYIITSRFVSLTFVSIAISLVIGLVIAYITQAYIPTVISAIF